METGRREEATAAMFDAVVDACRGETAVDLAYWTEVPEATREILVSTLGEAVPWLADIALKARHGDHAVQSHRSASEVFLQGRSATHARRMRPEAMHAPSGAKGGAERG